MIECLVRESMPIRKMGASFEEVYGYMFYITRKKPNGGSNSKFYYGYEADTRMLISVARTKKEVQIQIIEDFHVNIKKFKKEKRSISKRKD